jgi:hypothetical protein
VPRAERKGWARVKVLAIVVVILAIPFGIAAAYAGCERLNPFKTPSLTYMNHVKDGIGGDIPSSCAHKKARDSCMNEDLIEYLGPAVCKSLKSGTSGDEEVRRVAARPVVGQRNGEIIVYWAITDLCPEQMSKRKPEWAS